MSASHVSFIIPTLREHALGDSLDRLIEHLRALPELYCEIVVVDDSDEETHRKTEEEVARRAATQIRGIELQCLRGPRRGKGAAVRHGVQATTGDIVFTIDADLPVPLQGIEVFLATLRKTSADIVIAERPRDRYVDNPTRDLLSRGLRAVQTTLLFQAALFEDTQCGFKAFRGQALREIVERQVVDRGMYDLEYLYIATLRGFKVERIAVESSPEIRPSRVNVWRCLIFDPFDILRMKLRGIFGDYR